MPIGSLERDTTYLSAIRHATGDGTARNWQEARRLLARAALAGHEEAVMRLASLMALGGAGPVDWAGAIELLVDSASRCQTIVPRNLALLRKMALAGDGAPRRSPKVVPVCQSPKIAVAEGFLTPEECAHIRALAAPRLVPSLVADPRTGRQRPHPVRTSESAVIGPIQQDLVVHAVNRRIAAVTGTPIDHGEPLTVLRYRAGQRYRTHHDCLPGEDNQRIITAIVYLNDDFEGGATGFDALGQSIQPRTGDAVVFMNVRPDGRPDQRSRHSGLPVEQGEKWVATRWIRQRTFDPWNLYDRA